MTKKQAIEGIRGTVTILVDGRRSRTNVSRALKAVGVRHDYIAKADLDAGAWSRYVAYGVSVAQIDEIEAEIRKAEDATGFESGWDLYADELQETRWTIEDAADDTDFATWVQEMRAMGGYDR